MKILHSINQFNRRNEPVVAFVPSLLLVTPIAIAAYLADPKLAGFLLGAWIVGIGSSLAISGGPETPFRRLHYFRLGVAFLLFPLFWVAGEADFLDAQAEPSAALDILHLYLGLSLLTLMGLSGVADSFWFSRILYRISDAVAVHVFPHFRRTGR